MNHITWAWLMYALLGCCGCSRILVVLPSFSKSHHFVYRPVLQVLADRGHQITYLTSFPWDDKPSNVDQRFLDIQLEHLMARMNEKGFKPPTNILKKKATSVEMSSMYTQIFNIVVPTVLEHPVTQTLINSDEQYDLVISETMRGSEAYSAFTHRFNATGVVFLMRGDNSWPNELCGLPDNPSYMVDATSPFTDQMNFFQRLQNTYHSVYNKIMNYRNLRGQQEFVDKYFNYSRSEERPPIARLVSDQALVLVNSHFSVGYAYPKAPHVKEVGGTNIPEPKPLPKEMEDYLNDATHGLIYFSMGSNLDFQKFKAHHVVNIFAKVLSKRKERVFWKGTNEEVEGKFDNIFQSPWFPQIDVLAHNKTKAFVSHGGMLSITEAVSMGVPIVGIPVFGDQNKNLHQAVNSGYALMVELTNLTEASLSWALEEVINNPKYKENAMKQSKLFHDRPMKPVDEAVYWIEYVLRHGKVLQPASALMPFHQLYLLDILALILVPLAATIIIGANLIQLLWFSARKLIIRKEKIH